MSTTSDIIPLASTHSLTHSIHGSNDPALAADDAAQILTSFFQPALTPAYLPDGYTRSSILKGYPFTANYTAGAEGAASDTIILVDPHSFANTFGSAWQLMPDGGFKYLFSLNNPVDLSSFDHVRPVSFSITCFSDTISTTNANLSGRMSAITVYDFGKAFPTYQDMSTYAPEASHRCINVELSEGITIIAKPYYIPFHHITDNMRYWNFVEPNYTYSQALTPLVGSEYVLFDFGENSGPQHAGDCRLNMNVCMCQGDSNEPLYTLHVRGYYYDDGGDRQWVNFTKEISTQIVNFDLMSTIRYSELVWKPLVLTKVWLTITDNTYNRRTWVNASIWFTSPGCLKTGYDRSLIYIQGSIGVKNINLSGIINYQCIPKPEVMQQVSLSPCPAVSWLPLEVFNAYLAGYELTGIRLVWPRSQYMQFLYEFRVDASDMVSTAAKITGSCSTSFSSVLNKISKPIIRFGVNHVIKPILTDWYDSLRSAGYASVGRCAGSDIEDLVPDEHKPTVPRSFFDLTRVEYKLVGITLTAFNRYFLYITLSDLFKCNASIINSFITQYRSSLEKFNPIMASDDCICLGKELAEKLYQVLPNKDSQALSACLNSRVVVNLPTLLSLDALGSSDCGVSDESHLTVSSGYSEQHYAAAEIYGIVRTSDDLVLYDPEDKYTNPFYILMFTLASVPKFPHLNTPFQLPDMSNLNGVLATLKHYNFHTNYPFMILKAPANTNKVSIGHCSNQQQNINAQLQQVMGKDYAAYKALMDKYGNNDLLKQQQLQDIRARNRMANELEHQKKLEAAAVVPLDDLQGVNNFYEYIAATFKEQARRAIIEGQNTFIKSMYQLRNQYRMGFFAYLAGSGQVTTASVYVSCHPFPTRFKAYNCMADVDGAMAFRKDQFFIDRDWIIPAKNSQDMIDLNGFMSHDIWAPFGNKPIYITFLKDTNVDKLAENSWFGAAMGAAFGANPASFYEFTLSGYVINDLVVGSYYSAVGHLQEKVEGFLAFLRSNDALRRLLAEMSCNPAIYFYPDVAVRTHLDTIANALPAFQILDTSVNSIAPNQDFNVCILSDNSTATLKIPNKDTYNLRKLVTHAAMTEGTYNNLVMPQALKDSSGQVHYNFGINKKGSVTEDAYKALYESSQKGAYYRLEDVEEAIQKDIDADKKFLKTMGTNPRVTAYIISQPDPYNFLYAANGAEPLFTKLLSYQKTDKTVMSLDPDVNKAMYNFVNKLFNIGTSNAIKTGFFSYDGTDDERYLSEVYDMRALRLTKTTQITPAMQKKTIRSLASRAQYKPTNAQQQAYRPEPVKRKLEEELPDGDVGALQKFTADQVDHFVKDIW